MMRGLLSLAMLTGLSVSAATWVPGPKPRGEVRFTITGPLDDVPGATREVRGSLSFDASALAGTHGVVSVPLDSVRTGIEQRDADMREQFLQTSLFPWALLAVDRVERLSSSSLLPGEEVKGEAVGSFEVHGRRREVRVPVTLRLDDDARLWVSGAFDVPFAAYDVVRPARLFLKLGEVASVRFNVLFVPQAPSAVGAVATNTASSGDVAAPVKPTVAEVLPPAKPRPPVKRQKVSPPAASHRRFATSRDAAVRRGEALFFSPLIGRDRRISCDGCHAAEDERQGATLADGYLRPAGSVWNSARRARFWDGLATTPGGAADVCVRKFVDEAGLKQDERAALEAYLKAISLDPSPEADYRALYFTVSAALPWPTTGDAKRGEGLTKRHCGGCHDGARQAPALQRGLYDAEWLVRRVRWLAGHDSHGCPPQLVTRLPDSELRDIVSWLSGPDAGQPIFTRPSK